MELTAPPLHLLGSLAHRPDDHDLAAAEAELGCRLPPSYVSFVRSYGSGRTMGIFLVYVPLVPPPDAIWHESLPSRSYDLREELRERRRIRTPAQGTAVLDPLLPFGISENGDVFAWDTSVDEGPTVQREWPVVVVRTRSSDPLRVADSFVHWLHRALEPGAGGVLGVPAGFSLQPTFEPLPCFGIDG